MKKIFLIATAIVLMFATMAFAGREVKQSTGVTVATFITDSTDHVAGLTGLTNASGFSKIELKKNGGAFANIADGLTLVERGYGWYDIGLTTAHTDTLKDLVIHLEATGADDTDVSYWVVANIESDTFADVGAIKTVTDALPDAGALSTIQADLDNPAQYEADVSALAREATVDTAITNIAAAQVTLDALNDFDPAADEVNVGMVNGSTVNGVDDFKADVSAVCVEANVEGHVTTALNTYDPPTKAELDTAESNIRGADSDDLKDLSDALDAFDVSGLCLESTALIINTTVGDTNDRLKKGVKVRTWR